jgi:hypothetical protein
LASMYAESTPAMPPPTMTMSAVWFQESAGKVDASSNSFCHTERSFFAIKKW